MADLGILQLGTFVTGSSSLTSLTGSDPVLEAIASAADGSYVGCAENSSTQGVAVFDLGDTAANFNNMDTLSIQLRYWRDVNGANLTWDSLTAQVYQSDGTTALTNELTIASSITTTTATNSAVLNFTGVNTTSTTKTLWDGALVFIRFNKTRIKGGELDEFIVSAAEVTGTFTEFTAWSVGLTGLSTTTSSGTITYTVDDAVGLTSLSATTSSGTFTTSIDDNVALTSQQSTTSVGTPTTFIFNSGDLTTQSISTAVGSFTTSVDDALVITGVQATTAVGTFTFSIDDTFILSGQASTTSTGSLLTEHTEFPTSQEATTNIGSLVSGTGVTLPGVQTSTAVGTFSTIVTDSVVIPGVTASTFVGSMSIGLIQDRTVGLTGVQSIATTSPMISNVPPKFSEVIQRLSPGAILEFIEIDLTSLGDTKYYLHNGSNDFSTDVVWQGITYSAFPIYTEGFETSSAGSVPRPTLRVANISGLISVLLNNFGDMVGAKITRRRTFAEYLDAINFVDGNLNADPFQHFPDDVYYIDRKASESRIMVEFELSSLLDLTNVKLPRRQIIQNTCYWAYRSAECTYQGGAVADINDTPTADIQVDTCGKRLASCKLRFGTGSLPYGGFPGSGLVET